jgi:hypothetical protein
MHPASVEGGLSTGLYHKYFSMAGKDFPLRNDRWLLLIHGIDAKRRGGEPSPNPERQWAARFVHGEPWLPAGYSAPVFKLHSSPENKAREEQWHRQLFGEVSRRFGVRDDPEVKCWRVKEAQVDGLLEFLWERASAGEFVG